MKILIVTQSVDQDSPTLGFFVEWLREFSRQCERVDVVALSVGRHTLPTNVQVASMGKERGYSRPRRLFEFWRSLRKFLPESDGIFVHMCPEYLIAGWPFFRSRRKPIVFWYAHRARNILVRTAAWLATFVATSVPGAFTVATKKVRPLGQGVPTNLFMPLPAAIAPPYLFAAVGRTTPIKRLELLIDAVSILRKRDFDAIIELWGSPALPSDYEYEIKLREQAMALGISEHVHFCGAVHFSTLPKKYGTIAVALNSCSEGAIDKAVLEAMACARPVVVTNRNFSSVLGDDAVVCLADATGTDIADKLQAVCIRDRQAIGLRLRTAVVEHHSLPHLVKGVLDLMQP